MQHKPDSVEFTSYVLKYLYSLLRMETLKNLFYLSVRQIRVLKNYTKGRISVFTYIPKISSDSINVRHSNSEYFHIRAYSDIRTTVSQIFYHLYEHITNVFNMRSSVSIDTKIYRCKIVVINKLLRVYIPAEFCCKYITSLVLNLFK